jgi:hypothetical protein
MAVRFTSMSTDGRSGVPALTDAAHPQVIFCMDITTTKWFALFSQTAVLSRVGAPGIPATEASILTSGCFPRFNMSILQPAMQAMMVELSMARNCAMA